MSKIKHLIAPILVSFIAVLGHIVTDTLPVRADNVWIWGVCTDFDHPYDPYYEPYNFNAVFRVNPPYSGYYRLVDSYGHVSPPHGPATAGVQFVTGYVPVDYSPYFKERLEFLYNGSWVYIDQSAPLWQDDNFYYCL